MCKVQVPLSVVEDFLNEERAVKVTSFSWGEHSMRGEPDVEWELNHQDEFFSYEDDDYVEADEYVELEGKYKDVCESRDILLEHLKNANKELEAKEARIQEQAQTIIKYASAAKPKPKRRPFFDFLSRL